MKTALLILTAFAAFCYALPKRTHKPLSARLTAGKGSERNDLTIRGTQ